MEMLLMPFTAGTSDWDKHIWTSETGPQISAALLARLAEAADGKRDGKETWLVGQLTNDFCKLHRVLGYYPTAQAAFEDNKTRFDLNDPMQDRYKIFGPFRTMAYGTKKVETVNSVKIVLADREICLDGSKYDAVFWSESAFDKFVATYYTHVAGPDQASFIRTLFLDSEVVAAIHIPGSEIIDGNQTLACEPEHDPTLGLHLLSATVGKTGGVVVTPL